MQADDPISKNYPKTDLNNAFFIDEAAQKSGYFEARKHHQQYQEHLQSKHAKAGLLGCCRLPLAARGQGSGQGGGRDLQGLPRCVDGLQEDDAGTAQTAGGFFVRSHAFNPNPRQGGPTADMLPPPVYAYPKK